MLEAVLYQQYSFLLFQGHMNDPLDMRTLLPSGSDGSSSACGVCLLDTTQEPNDHLKEWALSFAHLNYGGTVYHATCANFWCNKVNSVLPALPPLGASLLWMSVLLFFPPVGSSSPLKAPLHVGRAGWLAVYLDVQLLQLNFMFTLHICRMELTIDKH